MIPKVLKKFQYKIDWDQQCAWLIALQSIEFQAYDLALFKPANWTNLFNDNKTQKLAAADWKFAHTKISIYPRRFKTMASNIYALMKTLLHGPSEF